MFPIITVFGRFLRGEDRTLQNILEGDASVARHGSHCWWSFRDGSWMENPTQMDDEQGSPNVHMEVSQNVGIPKSSMWIGFSIINHPFGGPPISGNLQNGDFTCKNGGLINEHLDFLPAKKCDFTSQKGGLTWHNGILWGSSGDVWWLGLIIPKKPSHFFQLGGQIEWVIVRIIPST